MNSQRAICCLLLVLMLGVMPLPVASGKYIFSVVKIGWNSDGSLLALGYGDNKTVEIQDYSTGQVIQSFEFSHFTDLVWQPTPISYLLAVGDVYGNIEVVNAQSGETIVEMENYVYGTITALRWSPDGTILAAGHIDEGMSTREDNRGIVKLWDATTGQLLRTFDEYTHRYRVESLAWSPDGTRIASGGTETVHIWNSTSGELEMQLDMGWATPGWVLVAWSPDGNRLLTAGASFIIQVWDGNTYQHLHDIDTFSDTFPQLPSAMAWRPDGQQIALLQDYNVRVLDGDTYQTVFETPRNPNRSRAFAWSPDSTQLAYSTGDGSLQILRPE